MPLVRSVITGTGVRPATGDFAAITAVLAPLNRLLMSSTRSFAFVARRVLAIVAWLFCAAAASHADPILPSYLYGIDDDNDIYQIDPTPGQQTFNGVYNTGLIGQSNAFAFDRVRDQMFFMNVGSGSANNLWLWNKPINGFTQIAAGTALGVSGTTIPANAAYYNDAFWFFKERTNDLVRASLVYSGTAPGTVPTLGAVDTFTINPAPTLGPVGSGTDSGIRNAFGDIAISPSGTLYAYTAGGQGGNFYSLDLTSASAGTVGGFNLISSGTTISGTTPIGLQISFNEDYSVLYGHNYNDGKWYTVDTTSGGLTDLSFVTTTGTTGTGFRDIGGASISFIPEPTALALLGTAAAALTTTLRRRRSPTGACGSARTGSA